MQRTLHVSALLIQILGEEVSVVWKQVLRLKHTSQSAQESEEDAITKEHNLSVGAGLDVSISIFCELVCV